MDGVQIMQGERGVVAHVTLPHAHELAQYDTLELDFALGCPGALPAPSRAVLLLGAVPAHRRRTWHACTFLPGCNYSKQPQSVAPCSKIANLVT